MGGMTNWKLQDGSSRDMHDSQAVQTRRGAMRRKKPDCCSGLSIDLCLSFSLAQHIGALSLTRCDTEEMASSLRS